MRERIQRCANPEPINGGKPCEGGTKDDYQQQIKYEKENCTAEDEDGQPIYCPSRYLF